MDLYLRKAGGGGSKGGLVFLHYTFTLVFVATIDWSGTTINAVAFGG